MRLTVLYEDSWALSHLQVTADGRDTQIPATHEVLVWTDEAWADREITIEVSGLRDGRRYAFGRVLVKPLPGTEIHATITLSRLPCGAWCSEGTTACESDGVVVCEAQADGCLRWSDRVACPSATPSCSFGICDSVCIDECAEGERRCAGPFGVETCGQADSDACLDWMPPTSCGDARTCSLASCRTECLDECEAGAVSCQNGGLSHCADRDFDGCAEWGPSEACAPGESCERGVCRPVGECTDLCTASECSETTLTQCGNFDLDPCLEPSPGTSCVPADACMDGRCTLEGCESTPRVCDSPPPPSCLDLYTLRTHTQSGTCTDGACEYGHVDTACTIECESGRCTGGCEGVVCQSPPADTCADASTLRSHASVGTCTDGSCSYAATDTRCPFGCAAGACTVCAPIDWTSVTVDSTGNTGAHTSIEVDPAGGVHISYRDDTNDDLRYAYRSPGGSWSTTTVDSAGDTGSYTSLVLDATGGAHVVYYDVTNGDLRYAHRSDIGEWMTSTVDSTGNTGQYASIAIDSVGGLHVGYLDITNAYRRYAYRSRTGEWTVSTLSTVRGLYFSVAVDSSDGVHLSHYSPGLCVSSLWSDGELRHAYRPPGGAWVPSTTVAGFYDMGQYSSLAVDPAGNAHISYYDASVVCNNMLTSRGYLRYAYGRPGGTWSTVYVDRASDTGQYTSIAVDASSRPHISYYDATNGNLRYATPSADGSWTTTSVDSDGNTGMYTSIAVDSAGGVHISYRDATNGDLRYAYQRVCP